MLGERNFGKFKLACHLQLMSPNFLENTRQLKIAAT
jgi:hypothetical protein